MIKTLLFDLDNTLLGNDIETFTPPYLQALAQYTAAHLPAEALIAAIMHATNLMLANTDPARTLAQLFGDYFYPALQSSEAALRPMFDRFYNEVFPTLAHLTDTRPAARKVIQWALSQGYEVVIATNPLFPRRAIEVRLSWAGLNVDEFPFALLTTYEDFHFTKPHPDYYAEILARLQRRPEEALMVGNDWERDIVPAAQVGLNTYWIAPHNARPPTPAANIAAQGSIADFLHWVRDKRCIDSLLAQPLPLESYLARLNAVPATLLHLTNELADAQWHKRPAPNEWSASETVQHLIDAEITVLQPQLELVLREDFPFISKIDLEQLAAERPADAPAARAALEALVTARQHTLARLRALNHADWNRPARHAIFGPTTLRELVSFTLDHDWKHLRYLHHTLGNDRQPAANNPPLKAATS